MRIKRCIKRIGVMIGAVVLALAMGIGALAAGDADIDLSKTGKLKIKLDVKQGDIPVTITEVTFTIYQVQEWVDDNGTPALQWLDEYQEIGAEIGDLLTLHKNDAASGLNDAAKKLYDYIEENGKTGISKTSSDGSNYVAFDGLALGTYLVVWTNQPKQYKEVEPFLVFVPWWDGETDVWQYELTAYPKTEPLPQETPGPTPTPGPKETPRPEETPEPESTPAVASTPSPTPTPSPSSSPGPALSPANSLPQTGTLQWPIPVLAGLGIVLFLAGLIINSSSKKKAKSENAEKSGKGQGKFLIILGPVMIAGGLGLLLYNNWDSDRAAEASENMLIQIEEKEEAEVSEEITEEGIASLEIDGYQCMGVIEIPVLDITLPVIKELSYPGLKVAPCRYVGDVEDNSLIVAAHNYPRHFGNIYLLSPGDEVIFSDVEGNVYDYEVTKIEVLDGTAVEEMQEGDWDLTLFTCTYGGKSRITVRCNVQSEI